jgi:hypothetical protein
MMQINQDIRNLSYEVQKQKLALIEEEEKRIRGESLLKNYLNAYPSQVHFSNAFLF